MNFTRAPTRPIAITAVRPPQPTTPVTPAPPLVSPPRRKETRTPLGSQTIFPLSLDSPASPPDLDDLKGEWLHTRRTDDRRWTHVAAAGLADHLPAVAGLARLAARPRRPQG
ncbi:RNA-binding protein 42-like [Ostrinia nubilalis]|uniref:RNA-binding protein 42-like n=1 Tax=Ostrinia nubilalis TaxID=29057 RepID=UPI0030823869